MTAPLFAILTVAAFVLAAAPLVIEGIRHGSAGNVSNAILFGIGVAVAMAAYALDYGSFAWSEFGLGVLLAVGLLGAAAAGVISGGVAKSCIALLPWFSIGTFVWVLTAGMLIAALVGLVTKRNALIAPPLAASGAAALALPLIG
jgi:hypothetical protein